MPMWIPIHSSLCPLRLCALNSLSFSCLPQSSSFLVWIFFFFSFSFHLSLILSSFFYVSFVFSFSFRCCSARKASIVVKFSCFGHDTGSNWAHWLIDDINLHLWVNEVSGQVMMAQQYHACCSCKTLDICVTVAVV